MTREYMAPDWMEILHHNRLASFDALWRLDPGHWSDALNRRGQGWSGVFRHELALPGGGTVGVFIKRQSDFFYRSWRKGFRAAALFEREFRNIRWFQRLGIPTLEPVYFGERRATAHEAILVTRELAGYQPLDAAAYNPIRQLPAPARRALCADVAAVIRRMHMQHVQFNCLYPKHIFVRAFPEGRFDVRLIDLEKAKWRPFARSIAVRDLASLQRRTEGWSRTDRLRFFLAYCGLARLDNRSRRLLRAVLRRVEERRHA